MKSAVAYWTRIGEKGKDSIMPEREQLVEKALAGNRPAMLTLIQAHQRLVAMIVFRMIPRLQDREEICQEVFLKIFENLASFRGEAKLSTWIGRIAFNVCLNQLQKKKVPLFADLAGQDESLDNVAGKSIPPDLFTEREELRELLQREIANLAPGYRTALMLFHVQGLDYDEIGRVMALPTGTVKSHIFRARQQLRERLLSSDSREE